MSVAGLTLGVVAVVIALNPLVAPMSVLPGGAGVVLSGLGLMKARKTGQPRRIAVAGLVVSLVGAVLGPAAWWAICNVTVDIPALGLRISHTP